MKSRSRLLVSWKRVESLLCQSKVFGLLPNSEARAILFLVNPAAIAGFLRRPASVLQIYSASLFFDSVGRVYGYLGGAPAVYISTADATIEGSGAVATDVSFPS